MDMSRLFYILLQGFVIGAGPCLLICAPIIVPYIAGTKRSWQEGLKATLIFSFTRLFIYTILGAASGLIGAYLIRIFISTPFGYHVWSVGASFIIVLGLLIIFGKKLNMGFCRFLNKYAVEGPVASMVILGLLVGLSPCLPLIGILIEIALLSERILIGALYGFTFGIGTVLSPLLLLGALAPVLPGRLLQSDVANRIFNSVCGVLLVLVGGYILLSRL